MATEKLCGTGVHISLGSLFDGIGGFPYAASLAALEHSNICGIEPKWASEILPQAVSVTARHFPDMKHVGDITGLDGAKLPPVDIIAFGSPCQDLSVAGKRRGLDGERSGLFTEAIRIIYEMRGATNGEYPSCAVWENVPGALSSAGGRDFAAVLAAFAKAEVPIPVSGRWANAGMVRGDGVGIAWRVLNACMWGVPQRRRRIFLVASFGTGRAGEILFVEKSLRGHTAPCGEAGQGAAADATRGAGGAMPGGMIPFAANQRDEVRDLGVSSGALAANPGMKQQTFIAENCMTPWDTQQSRVFTENGASPALAGADGGGGRNPGGLIACEQRTARTLTARGDGSPNADSGPNMVAVQIPAVTMRLREGRGSGGKGPLLQEERSGTLAARGDQYLFKPTAIGVHQNQSGEVSVSDTAYALATNGNATGRNSPLVAHPDVAGTLCASGAGLSRPAGMASEPDLCVAYALQGNMIGRQEQNGPSGSGVSENLAFTLTATDTPGVAAALPIPIHDKATRHNGGGKTRDNDGAGNGLGVGKPGDPAPTVTAGDHHAVASLDCRNLNESAELSGTLAAKGTGGYSLNFQNPVRNGYTVRRLTPTECERLQGFPDGWTAYGHDGKEISDTRRYQMLGNSVAIPCVRFVLGNIAEQIREEVLGDGIRPCA